MKGCGMAGIGATTWVLAGWTAVGIVSLQFSVPACSARPTAGALSLPVVSFQLATTSSEIPEGRSVAR